MVQGDVEAVKVLLLAPLDLAQGAKAREQHVFQMGRQGDVLGPEIRLDTQDVGSDIGRNSLQRLIAVNLLQRNVSADGKRFLVSLLSLVIVEIHIAGWGHDGIEALGGRLDAALHAPPGHHRGAG